MAESHEAAINSCFSVAQKCRVLESFPTSVDPLRRIRN